VLCTATVPPASRTISETSTPSGALALERRFPGIASKIARYPLTVLPTPVEPLERLGAAAGIGSLWVKRDDRSCPLYGGNKPRKLEWLIGDALRRGRRTLLTFGGIGTNHGLATTICARAAGLRTVLILVPQPLTDDVRRNLLLDHAFGAELILVSGVLAAAAAALRRLTLAWLGGERPMVVPTGGTSALGALGYVNAGLELAEQVRVGELPEPDWVFVPLGSGGTAAGLALGLKMAGLRSRVAAVLVTDILAPSQGRLLHLANAAARRLVRLGAAARVEVGAADLRIVGGFIGAGYGAVTEEAVSAQRLLDEHAGIRLETTYSGKCLAALLRLAREPEYRDRNLLFWNTYSSVDPGKGVRLPDPSELPPAFRRFFSQPSARA
jgi:D-cysteine desulfhydrase